MKKNREIQKQKKKTAVYFTLVAAAVSIFIFLFIYPANKQAKNLKKEISEINIRIKKQEILHPAYSRLMVTEKEIDNKIKDLEKTKFEKFLNHNNILMLPDSFRKIASRTGMKLLVCSPDINSAGSGKKEFQLRLQFTGDFINFSELISVFEAEKKITDIDSIEITQGKEKIYFIKLWLNMDK
ncbi:MAG: hypothetical protein ACQEQS_07065 [Thermodesulfobacteriota bacterium]